MSLDAAYMSLTPDVITEYSFGEPRGRLEGPDVWKMWKRIMKDVFEAAAVSRHLPMLFMAMQTVPNWMVEKLSPDAATFLYVRERRKHRAAELISDHEVAISQGLKKDEDQESVNLFDEILTSDLPSIEKDLDHLTDNGLMIVAADADTTALLLINLA